MLKLPDGWREAYRDFALGCERPVALHDCDADGLTSGVLWQRTLERAGMQPVRLVTQRQRNAWSEGNREHLAAHRPHGLFVLDLGCKSEPLLEDVATCFVDHHRPDEPPAGGLLLSGYGLEPIPTTSWLVYELAWVDLDDLLWLAAVGIVGDLGDKAPFELLARAKKRYKLQQLKEVAVLVNAARRSSTYEPWRAADALLHAPGPAEFLAADGADLEYLRECRAEVAAAMQEGKKAAPKFAGQVALVRVHSPCQIHPLLAQIWRTRLPKYYVLVANTGYVEGRVHFSARSAGDRNVLEFLQSMWDTGGSEFGHGHDQASGGAMSTEEWERFSQRLGFFN
jgi:single-stranded-DNA-specific exonuclease